MKNCFSIFLVLFFSNYLHSQTATLDNTFNVGSGFTGLNSTVITTSIQSDNKIVAGGSFLSINGLSRNCITRLNSDGTNDLSFNPGLGFSNIAGSTNVTSTAIQSDGKIIAVGSFDNYNGSVAYYITRINSNGAIDATFNSGSGFNGTPRSICIQPDGKIIVGGVFSSYNGNTYNNIIRLNSDGSIDNTFTIGTGFDNVVRSIKIQTDGKIIIVGGFSTYNGVARNNIVRLNINGSLDMTFDPGSGFNGIIYSSIIQNDGKIILGGSFSAFNGNSLSNIARLNSDGTIDLTFNSGTGFNSIVNSICMTLNGKIIAGGLFTSYNGISRNHILRLNSDGSLDNSFSTGIGLNNSVYSFGIQSTGKIIAGGPFSSFEGTTTNGILRLIICEAALLDQLNINQCDQYESPTGTVYTQSGIYLDTLSSIIGCDSIYLTINLTILNSTSSTFSQSICNGDVYTWNGQYYTNSGIYSQILQGQNGCDSTVTLNLNVNSTNFNPTLSSTQQLFTSPPFAVQFSNTTTNPSNYIFTWYWGDGTSTTTNNATVFHEYLTNGLYTVTLEATNVLTGCSDETTFTDYIYTTGGVSCTHSATIDQVGPITACSGQGVVLSCNSAPSYTYQWRKNGVYISGNNNDTLMVSQQGAYSVIITENGCPVSSGEVNVNFTTIAIPVISTTGTIQPCSGGSVNLSTTAGYSSYLWSNGATSQSTSVTSSGNYTVQVTNSSGCSTTSTPYTVNASILPTQNICVVGVDSITNNIRVVWEKPNTNAIDSFYVYKESSVANVYEKVGARLYDSLSVWLDPASNPAVQAYRYKITALDTCGSETPLSDFHKTIHLTINQGVGGSWNLIWSHYEGINFGSYNIYSGTSPSNLTLLTSIQSNLNSYTDLTPPVGNVYYQIEIINPNNCNPTKVINYSSSKSNIVTNSSSGLSENASEYKVYPNPVNHLLNVVTIGESNEVYMLLDSQGRKILEGRLNGTETQINVKELTNGTYVLKIGEDKVPVRVIKQ